MSRLVSLDRVYHYTDPKLLAIDALLMNKGPKKLKLIPRCQLLNTATDFVKESRRKTEISSTHLASDDVRSISSNNSKLRQRKKKKYNDISEVLSVDYQNVDFGLVLKENYS